MSRVSCLLGCVIVLAAMFEGSSAQTTHTVLDNVGWVIPFQGGAGVYTTWAANKTFIVGDTLFFNFTTGQHDVAQVTRTSFDSCAPTNTIGPIILNGPANVILNSTGEHYYICTVGPHCVMGQKLAINVTGSSPPSSTPTGAPTTPAPPTADGPTTEGPTTSPTLPQPTGPTTAPPPPSSASVAITTSRFVALGSVVLVVLGIIA